MAEAQLDTSAPPRIGPRLRGDLEHLRRAAELLVAAHRPLIIAGDEVAKSRPWPNRGCGRSTRCTGVF